MIVYVTLMDTLPANCLECTMNCNRPISKRDYSKILKPYITKRHQDCPLMELPEPSKEEVTPCE